MCGVSGGFAFGPAAAPADPAVVERLSALQRHRGPDGEGLWRSADGRAVLGHRRLAVVDIGPSGAQPMTDATGRWTISFNGEIYNYRALRGELERAGRRFLTGSDTEVLINAVAHWGEAGLKRLRGMFAFALWDDLRQELWLVRDPYGIKPLYLADKNGTIWFASQARALAEAAPVDTRRSAAALVGFYMWGHVPEPFCWWSGIRMLPAGHLLRIVKGEAAAAPRCYSRIQDAFAREATEKLGLGELHDAVLDSVRHHLVADVPVGLFLSAGVDSGAIAALCAETGTKLHTVTASFREYAGTGLDEAPYAEAVAKRIGSDHTAVAIERAQFDEMLPDFLRRMDQPTIDGLNIYLVSHAAAKRGLKVALSGLGGDELFGGYPSFRQIPQVLRLGRWTGNHPAIRQALSWTVGMLPLPMLPPKTAGLFRHAADMANAYLLRRALYIENELDALIDERWLRAGLDELQSVPSLAATLRGMTGASEHAQVATLESCWYMRNQLLRDADWAGMAHGVEVRVPFVDVPLLDRLGPHIASASPPSKADLAACAGGSAAGIVARRKTGFTTPVRDWINGSRRGGPRGLRGWAAAIHRDFRMAADRTSSRFIAA